ncbi:MAG: hypothetical protein LC754_02495 [Acidobacteria bacterium]|nr:hypothetical protein [Acidobacteriota bacterium]
MNTSSPIFISKSGPEKALPLAGQRTKAFLLAFMLVAAAATTRAQVRPPHQQTTSQQLAARQADESESGDDVQEDEAEKRPRATDPATIVRAAHFIAVRSMSDFISQQEVEDSLRKRKEFQAWGMAITRNEGQADLIIEITRKAFTRRLSFTIASAGVWCGRLTRAARYCTARSSRRF